MEQLIESIVPYILRMEVAIPTAVGLVVIARLWFGDTIFDVRHIRLWNTVRRLKVPVLNRIVLEQLPFDFEMENEAHENEFVGTTPLSERELAKAVSRHRDIEVPLLAGLKNDWMGNTESATWVGYHGPPPWGGAPDWLRPRQTHVTLFRLDSGVLITAHEEANSYRPDLWHDHLFKGSFNAPEGVRRTIIALEEATVEWEHDPEKLDVSSPAPESVDGGDV